LEEYWYYLYIYIYQSNEIFSPSNKIRREVGRTKDLSAPRITLMSIVKSVDKCKDEMTHTHPPPFWYSSAKVLGTNHGQPVNNRCTRMLLLYRDSIDGKDVDAIGQGSRTSSMRARNGTRRDFLGTRHSLLSPFLLPDQCLYIVKSMSIYTYI
jgi:hypothetical protein